MKKTYKILSIDAWGDCCGCDHKESDLERCWAWNNWFNVGSTNKIPNTVKEFLEVLDARPGVDPNEFELDDDQYNIVLVEKKTNKPLYAVEYGNQI